MDDTILSPNKDDKSCKTNMLIYEVNLLQVTYCFHFKNTKPKSEMKAISKKKKSVIQTIDTLWTETINKCDENSKFQCYGVLTVIPETLSIYRKMTETLNFYISISFPEIWP